MRYWLIMPAAGSGQRYGAALPKQHQALASGTVLSWALEHFTADERCRGIVLVCAAGDERGAAFSGGKLRLAPGGARRCDSVQNGLAAVDDADADDWVLVHDAARPCLSRRDLDRLLAAGSASAEGALLATPLSDTLKRAVGSVPAAVQETVERSSLWRALTPQMFRKQALMNALQVAVAQGREPTDESQAMEWAGYHPLLVKALDNNPKITTPQDLALAAVLLAAGGGR